ncbi:feather keratin B-4-like [Catharus ustulatus]|uniref:feather keratin B-4-like n=1 Tax=Catharus ustulatus TaxID=91951 RepID=UPI0014082870|nr:feather keratin B-4-like [Catharus ustulatus]
MACYNICRPCGPTPLANSCNEPCALQCQDSHVVIQPSPVQVTLPGPIMTSFPQNTAVGSTSSAAVGTELSVQGQPISGGFGGFGGLGGFGYGRGFGYGLGCGYGLGGLGCYGRRGRYNC